MLNIKNLPHNEFCSNFHPVPVLSEIKISPYYRASAASGQKGGEILTVDGDFHSPGVGRSDIVLGATFIISCCVPSYSGYVQIFSALELLGYEHKEKETYALVNSCRSPPVTPGALTCGANMEHICNNEHNLCTNTIYID